MTFWSFNLPKEPDLIYFTKIIKRRGSKSEGQPARPPTPSPSFITNYSIKHLFDIWSRGADLKLYR